MGNKGNTAKIELLLIFSLLNGVFSGNFTPYSQEEGHQRLKCQNWTFKIFLSAEKFFMPFFSLKHKFLSLQHFMPFLVPKGYFGAYLTKIACSRHAYQHYYTKLVYGLLKTNICDSCHRNGLSKYLRGILEIQNMGP